MLVPHCSALLPLADRNVTGRLVYDRLWASVCVFDCAGASLTTTYTTQIQQREFIYDAIKCISAMP